MTPQQAEQIARIAATTRDAQRRYFRTRSTADLRVAKDWEAKLDRAIAAAGLTP